MNRFAKLYEFEEIGQVLVVRDMDDEGSPCLRFTVQLNGMTSSIEPAFDDTEEGYAQRDKAFDLVEEEGARQAGSDIVKQMRLLLCAAEEQTKLCAAEDQANEQ